MNLKLKSNKYSGKRDLAASIIYKLFNLNIKHIKKIDQNSYCSNCESEEKIFYYSKTIPDFKVRILPKNLFDKIIPS